MKTKNIFKALALAMLMPAMLLTTACSNDDDLVNNTANTENTINKGYALPVTVNVTREGDATTRATYNESTRKLEFSAGDKLFVGGNYDDWDKRFAGTLDYDAESGKFKGTIYTQDDTYKTYEDLFGYSDYTIATLLPAGYKDHGYLVINTNDPDAQYDDFIEESNEYTLATSKADGVAQFSYEKSYNYDDGFALSPYNAILNFTVTGLAASTSVNVSLTSIAYNITGTVTTDASGNAKFAAGIMAGINLQPFSLTVGGKNITIVSSDKVVEEGKIYNITRSAVDPNAPLPGIFSISAGQTVQFSKGNLQYQASTGTWRFAEHQYDYVGNAAGNNTSSGRDTQSDWIDLFGWGTSGKTFASGYGTANQPWATSTTNNQYGPTDGSSGLTGDYANGDWGVNMGTGWRTLTSDEWSYLFNDRTTGGTVFGTTQARYTEATINTDGTGVNGIILFPDGVNIASGEVTTAGTVNSGSAWATKCTTAQWAALESKGCVFLPAAGYRSGTSVTNAGTIGLYWSSTPNGSNYAFALNFMNSNVFPVASGGRKNAGPVRLVQEVVTP